MMTSLNCITQDYVLIF